MASYKSKPEETSILLHRELRRRGMTETEIATAVRKRKRSRVLTFNVVKKPHLMDMRAATASKSKAPKSNQHPRERQSATPDMLCTVHFAAEQLKLHRKTILRFIRDGQLPAARIGKSYRIKRTDLEAFSGLPAPAPATIATKQPSMTSIVDIPDVRIDAVARWQDRIGATLSSRRKAGNTVRAEVIHESDRSHLKIVVVGPPNECMSLLSQIHAWMDQS